jgi:hypothetical protein
MRCEQVKAASMRNPAGKQNWRSRRDMTAEEFRAAVHTLKLTKESASRFVGRSGRAGQRWATKGVEGPVAVLFRVMIELDMTPSEVETILPHQ